jgi:hypothetical protein
MRKFFRDNGLSIVLIALFLVFFGGQSVAGWFQYNDDQREHGEPTVDYAEYLTTPHFLEATMENFESEFLQMFAYICEFLQMFAYILLTAYLFQRGSSESKDPDKPEAVDRDPNLAKDEDSPWPVRQGGIALKLYENSLCLTFFALFVATILLHAYGGAQEYQDERAAHGSSELVTTFGYMTTAQFWFESLQNWQSEFLSTAVLVVLSIVLRQRESPESKPVAAPHAQTGV